MGIGNEMMRGKSAKNLICGIFEFDVQGEYYGRLHITVQITSKLNDS